MIVTVKVTPGAQQFSRKPAGAKSKYAWPAKSA
ncbi:hypothetical protein ABH935_009969 [Catenulispora sp. GAS73]